MQNDDDATSEQKGNKSFHNPKLDVADRIEIGTRLLLGLLFGGMLGGMGYGLGSIFGSMIGLFVSIPFAMVGFIIGCFFPEIRLLIRLVLPFLSDS